MPALLPVFPLQKPISFVPQGLFSQLVCGYGLRQPLAGRPEDEIPPAKGQVKTAYDIAQQSKWDKLIQSRIRVAAARRKFNDASILYGAENPTSSRPDLKATAIESYRLQFRIIDLNGDGLIDFKELCNALDKIGDKSTEEQRRKYFTEVDTDHSDGVDFEEFLELVERVQKGGGGCLSKVCTSTQLGVQDVFRITQLSPLEQIKYKLF